MAIVILVGRNEKETKAMCWFIYVTTCVLNYVKRMPVFIPNARASYEQVITQVPCLPLVTASARPRHSG